MDSSVLNLTCRLSWAAFEFTALFLWSNRTNFLYNKQNNTWNGCLKIWNLFPVLNRISHSFSLLALLGHVHNVCVFKSTPFSKSVCFRPSTRQRSVFESLRFHRKRRLSKMLNKRLRVDGKAKTNRKVSVFEWKRIRVDVALGAVYMSRARPDWLILLGSYRGFKT